MRRRPPSFRRRKRRSLRTTTRSPPSDPAQPNTAGATRRDCRSGFPPTLTSLLSAFGPVNPSSAGLKTSSWHPTANTVRRKLSTSANRTRIRASSIVFPPSFRFPRAISDNYSVPGWFRWGTFTLTSGSSAGRGSRWLPGPLPDYQTHRCPHSLRIRYLTT